MKYQKIQHKLDSKCFSLSFSVSLSLFLSLSHSEHITILFLKIYFVNLLTRNYFEIDRFMLAA